MLNVAYKVSAVYKCNICKEDHQISLGLPDLLPDPSARMAEMVDIKIRIYDGIKKLVANMHAPTDKFNPKKLTITETDDKGKFRKVKISDIEQLLKGGMSEIEKIDVQKRLGNETAEKLAKIKEHSSAGLALTAKESPVEEEETPFKETGQKEGMSFEEIREKVEVRIKELQKANKNCREAMDKLGIQFKETRIEMIRLQSLLKAIDQPEKKGKNNGRKKRKRKQSLKSK